MTTNGREFLKGAKDRIVSLVVLTAVALAVQVAAAVPEKPVNILYLGDSISDFDRGSNHVDRLQAKLDVAWPGKAKIYNYAVRGDYIERLFDRLEGKPRTYALDRYADMWSRSYDWAFVFLGHNDTRTWSDTDFALPEMAPEKVRDLMGRLVDFLREKGIRRIILLSPSSSNYDVCAKNVEKKLARIAAGKGGKATKAARFGEPRQLESFAETVRAVAKERHVEFLDIYAPMKALPDKAELLRVGDGVHFSAKGHIWLAERESEYLLENDSKK